MGVMPDWYERLNSQLVNVTCHTTDCLREGVIDKDEFVQIIMESVKSYEADLRAGIHADSNSIPICPIHNVPYVDGRCPKRHRRGRGDRAARLATYRMPLSTGSGPGVKME